MKRLAFAQTANRQPSAAHHAMFLQRITGVSRTTWIESAAITKKGANKELVGS
jgi:hypothetical protein